MRRRFRTRVSKTSLYAFSIARRSYSILGQRFMTILTPTRPRTRRRRIVADAELHPDNFGLPGPVAGRDFPDYGRIMPHSTSDCLFISFVVIDSLDRRATSAYKGAEFEGGVHRCAPCLALICHGIPNVRQDLFRQGGGDRKKMGVDRRQGT